MHDEGAFIGAVDEGFIDLITGKVLLALGCLSFHAHGDPHVGVQQVGTLRDGVTVFSDTYVSAGLGDEIRAGLVGLWRSNAQFKTKFSGCPNPANGHVAGTVANEGDDLAGDGASRFLEGENIRDDLAGMLGIGQGVDGRDAGVMREILHVALRVGADDCAVHHAAEHAGGVLNGFAAAELEVIGIEKHHAAAQFADASLERHACAGGGLGEDHCPRLAGERLVLAVATLRFDDRGVFQNGLDGGGVHRLDA